MHLARLRITRPQTFAHNSEGAIEDGSENCYNREVNKRPQLTHLVPPIRDCARRRTRPWTNTNYLRWPSTSKIPSSGVRFSIKSAVTINRCGAESKRCWTRTIVRSTLAISHATIGQPGPSPPRAIKLGQQIGPYKLLAQLGEGGMGTVYMAQQDQPVRRRVAVKVIKPGMDSRQIIARFEAERQALALMNHEYIAKVFDAGTTDDGRPYFVMELVQGLPITEYCDQHRLTTEERLNLIIPVCQAIQHAHQKGVIHRDIKPSNVLVAEGDAGPVPKVIDFGLAKALQQPLTERTVFTQFGQVMGTLEYMSPEQAALNVTDIDTRTDVYALGVLLYELLTGSTPIGRARLKAEAFDRILQLIREEEPPRPSTRLSDSHDALPMLAAQRRAEPRRLSQLLRGDLDAIVMKALDKDRTRRYDSATGLAADIQRYLVHEPIEARGPSAGYRLRKLARKYRGAVATATAFVALLLAATVLATWLAVRARQAETEANDQRDRALDAEQVAKVEAETANQVADFLIDLFNVSAPNSVAAAKITVRDVLDRGAERISKELSSQPVVQARMMDAIGRVYMQLQILDTAKKMTTDAMELRKQLYGDAHLEIAASLDSLGGVYYLLDEMDQSESSYRQALEMRRKLLGKDHPLIADSLNGVASVLHKNGKFPEAEKYYRESLEMLERIHGENHPDVAMATRGLAAILWTHRPPDEVEAMYRLSLERLRKLYGDEHLATVDCMSDLGVILKNRGAYDEAETMYKQVIDIRKKVLGDSHPLYAQSLNNYAVILRRMERYDEAIELYREAFEIYRGALGDENVELTGPMLNLSAVLSRQGEHEEALQLATKAEAIAAEKLGDAHHHTNFIRAQLGWVRFKLGEVDEAEKILLAAHEKLLAAIGPEAARTDAARGKLFDFYTAREMPERAAEFADPPE